MIKRLLLLCSLFAIFLPLTALHAEEKEKKSGEEAPKKAIYHSLEPPFVVNLSGTNRSRFMQIKVQVMSREEKVIAALEKNDAALRHSVIMLLAHQSSETMRSVQGREQVRAQALSELQQVLSNVAGLAEGLEAVYFTDFVIQ